MNVAVKIRPSAAIQSELEGLAAKRATMEGQLTSLANGFDAVLLSGDDDAAAANQEERARLVRDMRRSELQLEALKSELDGAQEREAEQRSEVERNAASAARDALLKRRGQDYDAPAKRIAAFVREWNDIDRRLRAAGLQGLDQTLRSTPDERVSERDETYEAYVDEQGQSTMNAFPPGAYRLDPATGRLLDPTSPRQFLAERPRRKFTRHVPAKFTPGMSLVDLGYAVNLPGLSIGEEPHYRGQ